MQNGYHVYLKKCLLPVAPSKIQVKVNSQDKTVSLINDGEVSILKQPGLKDIEFEFMLPQLPYPFAGKNFTVVIPSDNARIISVGVTQPG